MEVMFNDSGLVPAIVQDYLSGKVLMQAYMNRESLDLTIEKGEAYYFSRSRQCLWKKGETSGNIQRVKEISLDCDGDCILLKVEQVGNACHTGEKSCFFNTVKLFEESNSIGEELMDLNKIIWDRKNNPKEGSYTSYLFNKGIDKILKKIGEETAEVIIAAKNSSSEEVIYEMCDLIYHLSVLVVDQCVEPSQLLKELARRGK